MPEQHVHDLMGVAAIIRRSVAKHCRMADDDRYVTLVQIASFAANHLRRCEDAYIVDETAVRELHAFTKEVIVVSVLSEMAAEGLVETAWDDKQNTMVMWKPIGRAEDSRAEQR